MTTWTCVIRFLSFLRNLSCISWYTVTVTCTWLIYVFSFQTRKSNHRFDFAHDLTFKKSNGFIGVVKYTNRYSIRSWYCKSITNKHSLILHRVIRRTNHTEFLIISSTIFDFGRKNNLRVCRNSVRSNKCNFRRSHEVLVTKARNCFISNAKLVLTRSHIHVDFSLEVDSKYGLS